MKIIKINNIYSRNEQQYHDIIDTNFIWMEEGWGKIISPNYIIESIFHK